MASRRAYAGAPVQTTLASGIGPTSTSIAVTSATGWPTGEPFFVVIDPGQSNEEKVLCTRSGTTLTVSSTANRGVDGTTAASHSSGAAIYPCVSATDLDEANAAAVLLTTGIATANIANAAVTTAKIADDAVTTAKIAASAVTSAKVAANAVATAAIVDAAVTTSKVNDAAVTTAKVADAAITSGKVADGAVTEAKIGTGAVTEGKLGTGAVTEAKIGSGAVTDAKIGTGAVVEAKIGTGAVTEAKIGTGAVTQAKIGTGAVIAAKLATDAVETDKIKNAAVDHLKRKRGDRYYREAGTAQTVNNNVTEKLTFGSNVEVDTFSSVTASSGNFRLPSGYDGDYSILVRLSSLTGTWGTGKVKLVIHNGARAYRFECNDLDGQAHGGVFELKDSADFYVQLNNDGSGGQIGAIARLEVRQLS